MNKLRIIGIVLLVGGLIINITINNWIAASLSGAMVVFGLYFTITGKPLFKDKRSE